MGVEMVARLFGPLAVDDGSDGEFGGIDGNVFYALTLSGVGNVHETVGGFDDGGIGVFAGSILEDEGSVPFFAVAGNGDVEGRAAGDGVVIDEEVAAVG